VWSERSTGKDLGKVRNKGSQLRAGTRKKKGENEIVRDARDVEK